MKQKNEKEEPECGKHAFWFLFFIRTGNMAAGEGVSACAKFEAGEKRHCNFRRFHGYPHFSVSLRRLLRENKVEEEKMDENFTADAAFQAAVPRCAEKLPVIDYHNHLNIRELAEGRITLTWPGCGLSAIRISTGQCASAA